MAKAYDKDFLVNVYMFRFVDCKHLTQDTRNKLVANASKLYDRVGKTEFRKYASVTPELIKEYLNA